MKDLHIIIGYENHSIPVHFFLLRSHNKLFFFFLLRLYNYIDHGAAREGPTSDGKGTVQLAVQRYGAKIEDQFVNIMMGIYTDDPNQVATDLAVRRLKAPPQAQRSLIRIRRPPYSMNTRALFGKDPPLIG